MTASYTRNAYFTRTPILPPELDEIRRQAMTAHHRMLRLTTALRFVGVAVFLAGSLALGWRFGGAVSDAAAGLLTWL